MVKTLVSKKSNFGGVDQIRGVKSWKTDKIMEAPPLRFEVHTIYFHHKKNFFDVEISAEEIPGLRKNRKNGFFILKRL